MKFLVLFAAVFAVSLAESKQKLCSDVAKAQKILQDPNVQKDMDQVCAILNGISSVLGAECKRYEKVPEGFVTAIEGILNIISDVAQCPTQKAVLDNTKTCAEIAQVEKVLTDPSIPKDLDMICNLIGRLAPSAKAKCQADEKYPKEAIADAVKILNIAKGILGCKSQSKLHPPYVKLASGINWNQIGCQFCEMIFNFTLQDLLSPAVINTTITDIQNGVCNKIPNQNYAQMCDNLILKYGKQLFAYIQQYLQPSTACGAICQASAHNLEKFHHDLTRIGESLVQDLAINWGQVGCDACHEAFTWLNSDLLSPQVINGTITAINQGVCLKLPAGQAQQSCTRLVQTYTQGIFQYIKQYLNPQSFCVLITACPSSL